MCHTAHGLCKVKGVRPQPRLFALSLYNETYIHVSELYKYLRYIKLLSALYALCAERAIAK